MRQRTKYRFIGAHLNYLGHKVYVWESEQIPGDSRVEQVWCLAEWFWGGMGAFQTEVQTQ